MFNNSHNWGQCCQDGFGTREEELRGAVSGARSNNEDARMEVADRVGARRTRDAETDIQMLESLQHQSEKVVDVFRIV